MVLTVRISNLDLLNHSSRGALQAPAPCFGRRRAFPNFKEVLMNSLQAVGLTFPNTYLTKAWSIPKFPTLNIEALLELQRKNAVAITKANQVVFDGLKTLAQRERDLFKSTVDEYTKVTSDVLTGASVEERATKQVDGAGHIYASSVARFLELSDIAVKTNVSAVDILNARITEVFDEFRALFAGRGASAAGLAHGPRLQPSRTLSLKTSPPSKTPSLRSRPPRPAAAARTAGRVAKATSKTSARGSKAASKTAKRAAKGRRRTLRS